MAGFICCEWQAGSAWYCRHADDERVLYRQGAFPADAVRKDLSEIMERIEKGSGIGYGIACSYTDYDRSKRRHNIYGNLSVFCNINSLSGVLP